MTPIVKLGDGHGVGVGVLLAKAESEATTDEEMTRLADALETVKLGEELADSELREVEEPGDSELEAPIEEMMLDDTVSEETTLEDTMLEDEDWDDETTEADARVPLSDDEETAEVWLEDALDNVVLTVDDEADEAAPLHVPKPL